MARRAVDDVGPKPLYPASQQDFHVGSAGTHRLPKQGYLILWNRQIGKATSGTWSPLIKKNLALASVATPYAKTGTTLKIEYTVEYQRETVTALVTKMPFYNPEHKRR